MTSYEKCDCCDNCSWIDEYDNHCIECGQKYCENCKDDYLEYNEEDTVGPVCEDCKEN